MLWTTGPISTSILIKEVKESNRAEYWCYPNHVAYEIKDSRTMCKGGRMTYGFGLWRSGCHFLVPWIWSSPREWHLAPGTSAGGNCLTDDADVIMTIYWECFRTGIYDGQYLYTLQDAIVRRENSADPEVRELTRKGRVLLQEIWDSIEFRPKYLAEGMWPDSEFDARCYEMAQMIAALSRYPETSSAVAPSVIVNDSASDEMEDFIRICDAGRRNGALQEIALMDSTGIRRWKSMDLEGKVGYELERNQPVLVWDIHVDHKVDGENPDDPKYPIGWPRLRIEWKKTGFDLSKYHFLSFYLRVDSNRDGMYAADWPFSISMFNGEKGRRFPSYAWPARREPGSWQHVLLPLSELRYAYPAKAPGIIWFQFATSEFEYQHGDALKFRFRDLRFMRLTRPILSRMEVPAVVLPGQLIQCSFRIMGGLSGAPFLTVTLAGPDGNVIRHGKSLFSTTRLKRDFRATA